MITQFIKVILKSEVFLISKPKIQKGNTGRKSCKLGNFTFIIECDSSAIMNTILPSLLENYGFLY